jgi:hypothetical protein
MAPRVDDVEIEDHLHVARSLEGDDGLPRRHVFRKREDFRVHDAAGRLLVVLEQLADLVARALLDQLEDGGRQRLGQVVDDRRGVVRREVVQETRDFLRGPVGEERRAPFGPGVR